MTVSTPPNQSAVNPASLADQVGKRVSSVYGSVYFDVTLPSGVVEPERTQIRNKFIQVVEELTGLTTSPELGSLCGVMFDQLTGPPPNTMPSHGSDMETELNRSTSGYLAKITDHCAANGNGNGTIGEYKGVLDLNGTDLYCIGTDGLRYCYHFFELEPNSGSSADSISMPGEAKFRICCVAKFDPSP